MCETRANVFIYYEQRATFISGTFCTARSVVTTAVVCDSASPVDVDADLLTRTAAAGVSVGMSLTWTANTNKIHHIWQHARDGAEHSNYSPVVPNWGGIPPQGEISWIPGRNFRFIAKLLIHCKCCSCFCKLTLALSISYKPVISLYI